LTLCRFVLVWWLFFCLFMTRGEVWRIQQGEDLVRYVYDKWLGKQNIFEVSRFIDPAGVGVVIKRVWRALDGIIIPGLVERINEADELRRKYGAELDSFMPRYRYIDLEKQGLMIVDYMGGEVFAPKHFNLVDDDLNPDQLLSSFKGDLLKVLDRVEALMAVNLIHGDLSPKNIVIEGEQAYLIDVDGLKCAGTSVGPMEIYFSTAKYADPSIVCHTSIPATADVYSIVKIFEDFVCELEHRFADCGWKSGVSDFVDKAIDNNRGVLVMPVNEIRDRIADTGNLVVL